MSEESKENKVYDPTDPIFIERNGKEKLWINKDLVQQLRKCAYDNHKDPIEVAEYFLRLGVNTVDHKLDDKIKFDVESL
jgi:hypothetical protein